MFDWTVFTTTALIGLTFSFYIRKWLRSQAGSSDIDTSDTFDRMKKDLKKWGKK
jgi:hypothetical protein